MHSHQFRQWPTKSDNFTTITTNISKCEEQTWQEGEQRYGNWGKRWRGGIKAECFTLYLRITSMHVEPSNESDYSKPLLGWKETSSYSFLLFNLIWGLLRRKCLQAFIALDNTYGCVKHEATHINKRRAKTVAIDGKGHVYWMMILTINARRSIALMTLHSCVKVQMDFIVNDDHPLSVVTRFSLPVRFIIRFTSLPACLSIYLGNIHLHLYTYVYIYIFIYFMYIYTVKYTSRKCQPYIDEAISREVIGGVKGQLNTVLHGYSSLHYYGTGDKAQYSRMFRSIPLYSWFIEILKAITSWLAAADLNTSGATGG